MGNTGRLEILLVEDNLGDIRLTQEALKEGSLCRRLSVVNDGVEAMAFLKREGKYASADVPDLVLLDLHLPKKSGHQVLREVKDDPHLRHIPVLVLTASDSEDDIAMTYDLHANCCINKPLDLERYAEMVKAIEQFWTRVAVLPDAGNFR